MIWGIMSYIFIVCLALIVFFSFSLITKPHKTLSEKIFAAWIFLLAITELSFFLHSLGLFSDYLLLFSIVCDTHVLHGSFFLLYVTSFIDPSFKLRRVHLLHLIPFFALIGLKFYFNKVLGVMDCYGAGCLHADNRYVDLLTLLKFLILGAYLFIGWHKVHDNKVHKKGTDGLSSIRSTWIYNIAIGVFILFSLAAIYKVMVRLGFGFLGDDVAAINILVSFFILVFLYMGNSYAYIFVAPAAGRSVVLDIKESSQTSSITSHKEDIQVEHVDHKFLIIEKYIISEQPYVEGQFTLRQLSERVNIPQNEISHIIQIKTGKFYCDYMNGFRVEALKEKLDDRNNDQYTIFALALDCGFASKTSFNRIFKNHTGETPSEYRDNKH